MKEMKESAPLRAVRSRLQAVEDGIQQLRKEREILQRQLDEELRREQDRFARAVIMKRDQGMTLAQIAEVMECSVGTVSRAIAHWRQVEGLPHVPQRPAPRRGRKGDA